MAEESTQQYIRNHDITQKLIANIDNGIILLDVDLEIYYYNKWLELHTHIKEKDILGKKIDTVFSNIKTKTLTRKIKTALAMGTPTFYSASTTDYLIPIKINQISAYQFEHMRQDVSIIPFDIEKKLVALFITDQTIMTNTHNQLQANIKKVHDLNQELIKERQTINERVILTKIDHEYTITEVSQAYLQLFRFEKESLVGKNIFEYHELTISKDLKNEILKHIDNKQVFKYEHASPGNEESEVWLLNTLVPEYDKNANHIGFIIFGEDITSAKLVQEHQAKLLESSRTTAMGEMISMIAHQWRQPLSVINTVIATLKIKNELNLLTNEITTKSYAKIEETVKYLSETIDDFRNFFKQNKELKTITVSDLFLKSTQLLKTEMDTYNIEYVENIENNLHITTYQNELIHTIINIIKNSIDAFQETNIEKKKIITKAYEEDSHIIIEITDNAGGIDEDTLSKVYEPYFSTKSKNGTGLGLYVSKTIIEEHLKGTIIMKSENGQTFTSIELPQKILITKE